MDTKISEFVDTYSDDIIYLQEARRVLLTHPLRREIKDLCDTSFCRMFAVIMIGSIEHMLEEWRKRDKLGILEQYFAERANNSERVQSLYEAFKKAGVNVDWEVFADYLAIKCLRNVIVHARWKTYEKEWLEQRGFPTDTRKLTEDHWRKMQWVNQNMMLYIALTAFISPSRKPSDKLIKLQEIAKETDDLGLVRKEHIPKMFWYNLEKISAYLYRAIEQTVLTEEYNWAKGRSNNEIEAMSHEDRKRLFYLAARRAGEDGFHLLVKYRGLAKEALDSWREYWRLTFEQAKVSVSKIESATKTLLDLHERGIYPEGCFIWTKDIPHDARVELIKLTLKNYSPLTEEQIVEALCVGAIVYEFIPNITATYLLTIRLPIVDPENTQIYLQEGEKAFQAMQLRHYWYTYVEYRSKKDFETLAFYRKMLNEFRR